MTVVALVGGVRRVVTRRGATMAAVTLEDLSGQQDLAVFPGALERGAALWVEDAIVGVDARVAVRGAGIQLVCEAARAHDPAAAAAGLPALVVTLAPRR